ncbi:hypothetical protein AA313_de0201946 [Arthrobotrys entomopaga]|nr:hypothetical protein AA313_de0201946 [Arthrobotrys entomopaga]
MVSTRRHAYKKAHETTAANEQAQASHVSPKKKSKKTNKNKTNKTNKKNKAKPVNATATITAEQDTDMIDAPMTDSRNGQGASEPEQTQLQPQSSVEVEIRVSSKPDASDVDDEGSEYSGHSAQEVRKNHKGKQERAALKPNTKKRTIQVSTKRKKNAGNLDEYDDETEDESTLREDMTLEEFHKRFSFRAGAMEDTLTLAYDDLLLHRESVEKRLKVVDGVIHDDIQEFNTNGLYDVVFHEHPKYRAEYQPLPAVLPGDPFPIFSDKFDETDPRVQALFPDDDRKVYEMGVFKKHLQSLDSSLESANKLLKAAEKIFLMAKGYKTTLERQSKWVETCCTHADTVKETYLEKRIKERNRLLNMKGKPVPMQNNIPAPTTRTTGASSATVSLGRKRKLDPTAPEPRRQKRRHQEYAQPVLNPDHNLTMALPMEIDSGTRIPDTMALEAPATPPGAERIIVEGFGDHTPGRTRRYKNADASANADVETMKDGILIDARPWTEEENSYLDLAMRVHKGVPGRWLAIKDHFGMPGQPLASRSAPELRARAQECKAILTASGIELPDYWGNLSW